MSWLEADGSPVDRLTENTSWFALSSRYSARPTSPFQILSCAVAVTSHRPTREPGPLAAARVRTPSASSTYSARTAVLTLSVQSYAP